MTLVYASTKTLEHVVSTAFRQWRADSHCNKLHGYALTFKVTFAADKLDDRNWVVDFGSLKPFKQWLEDTFDHKVVVAEDDPELNLFLIGHNRGVMDTVVVSATGCEAFARIAFNWLEDWLKQTGQADRVRVGSVECREHSANSAIVIRR